MASDKKITQLTNLDGNSIASSTVIYAVEDGTDYNIIYGDDSGIDGTRGLLYKIKNDIQSSWTDVTVSPGGTEYISLGSSSSYQGFLVRYTMKRGAKYRIGNIKVIHDGANAYANDDYMPSTNDSDGISVKYQVSVGVQVSIGIDADSSDANDTEMRYKIIESYDVIP